jgi:hypothetical protein
MRKQLLSRVGAALLSLGTCVACGGSSTPHHVEEVPIDDSIKRPTDLPPDEVGGSSSTASTGTADHGPSGPAPQPLDTGDAGATATTADAGAPAAVFVQRPGGLSEKECTEVVMKFAKLTTKETKVATPAAADLSQHPVYGPMLADCGKSATKKQHKCGMVARSSRAWKKCME